MHDKVAAPTFSLSDLSPYPPGSALAEQPQSFQPKEHGYGNDSGPNAGQ